MPAPSPLTAPAEAVEQLGEHPAVRLPVGVSDQHVHVSAGGLPPAVGATRHAQESGLQGQGCLSDLQEQKEGRRVRNHSLHALSATQHKVGHQASDFVGTELEVGWDKLEGAAALRRQHRAQPVGAFNF